MVKRLMMLSFIEKHSSVLIFDPIGVGKTYLATILAVKALKPGYSVMFAPADKMFHHLKLSIIDGSHDRTLRTSYGCIF